MHQFYFMAALLLGATIIGSASASAVNYNRKQQKQLAIFRPLLFGPSFYVSNRGLTFPLLPYQMRPDNTQNSFQTHPFTQPSSRNFLRTCANRCDTIGHDYDLPCQCNSKCSDYDDCCVDYEVVCLTCENKCKTKFKSRLPCQCNRKCGQFDNCCDDYQEKCPNDVADHKLPVFADDWSCVDRCNITGTDPTKPCQCNARCVNFGDCCADYHTECLGVPPTSCRGRCDAAVDPDKPCQCNKSCGSFNDCCTDYSEFCETTGPGVITNVELASLSEEFLLLDINNVVNFVGVNLQGANEPGGPDVAPLPLLTPGADAYKPSTISKFLPLLDNYFPAVGTAEVITAEEIAEEDEFLSAVFATPIFERLEQFLASKNMFTGNFRDVFYELWFGLYSRQSGILSSSGFEHIFLGELKSGVSGFHNWIYFANEEAKGTLNYRGYLGKFNMAQKGQAIGDTFEWLNNSKPIGSMFIGSSPEFELGLFTLCFYARRNSLCPVVLNGSPIRIQTYDIEYNGEKYVASAYPDVQS